MKQIIVILLLVLSVINIDFIDSRTNPKKSFLVIKLSDGSERIVSVKKKDLTEGNVDKIVNKALQEMGYQ